MKLRAYRLLAGETLADLAARLETTAATLSRWETGEHIPPRDAMAAIYRVTAGAVRPDDFYNLES